MKVLLCGGAGYIGTHVALEFLKRGDTVGILDNFSSGLRENISPKVQLFEGDVLDRSHLDKTLSAKWDMVVHLAAFKAAGESMLEPAKYANNNINGSLLLISACVDHEIPNFILSSSAAVYGEPIYLPVDEQHPTNPTNYYGYTKLVIEENLAWFSRLKGLNYVSLRYFNAAGYDCAGRLTGLEKNPTNLIPVVMETAIGKRKEVLVFGDDFDTPDGTGVRDYIHVNDLAVAHGMSFDQLQKTGESFVVNLGVQKGYSVLEVIKMTEKISGHKVPYRIVDRRLGDPAIVIADPGKAKALMGWTATHSSLESLLSTTWNTYVANNLVK